MTDSRDVKPPPAPGSLTLFDLPDEILAEIFQHVHAAYQLEKPGPPPLSYLLVHPRLNKLVWTIWDSVVVIPNNAKAVERFQARYTLRPSFLEHIKDLRIPMRSPCPVWLDALVHRLSKLSKLKTLRVESIEASAIVDQPPCDVILGMKCLGSFYLLFAGTEMEINPPLALRSVKTRLSPGSVASHDGLESLTLRIDRDNPLDSVPWQTLVAFELVLDNECRQLPQQFLRELSEQTKSAAEFQNLRRLRITLTRKMVDIASLCSTVLECFASADLQHLELDLGSHLDLNALKIPWDKLKRLTIRAKWDMTMNVDLYTEAYTQDAYARLTTCLAAFSHLTALTLVNLRWHVKFNLLDVEPPASKPSHYRCLPALHTFAQDIAESTNVLKLCISNDDYDDLSAGARACDLRFVRRLGEASFQFDRFTDRECRDHFPVAF